MIKSLKYSFLIAIIVIVYSCKSDVQKANETINQAIEMDSYYKKKNDSNPKEALPIQREKLPEQISEYTNPVKKIATQEELIKKYKVKTSTTRSDAILEIMFYDKKGDLIKMEYSSKSYNSKVKYSYRYDSQGRKIKEIRMYDTGKFSSVVYEYNEDNKIIQKTLTSMSGETDVYTYDYNIELNTMISDISDVRSKEFYDNRGLCVKALSYDRTGKLISNEAFTYDENGWKIGKISTVGNTKQLLRFENDKNGRVLQMHRTGLFDASWFYTYNEKGLLIESRTLKKGKETVKKTEYTFYE